MCVSVRIALVLQLDSLSTIVCQLLGCFAGRRHLTYPHAQIAREDTYDGVFSAASKRQPCLQSRYIGQCVCDSESHWQWLSDLLSDIHRHWQSQWVLMCYTDSDNVTDSITDTHTVTGHCHCVSVSYTISRFGCHLELSHLVIECQWFYQGIHHLELQVNKRTCPYPYRCEMPRKVSGVEVFRAIIIKTRWVRVEGEIICVWFVWNIGFFFSSSFRAFMWGRCVLWDASI